MNEVEGRRPSGARETKWARLIAKRLTRAGVSPNQISIASIGFAALAGAAFWYTGASDAPTRCVLYFVGGLGCQARLLCNLFDGMVAIEGGKSSKDGAFWNEFPDRIADIVILAGAGYGAGVPSWGWAAAAFAVLAAYVRELGRANGQPADYVGPMAKQHRMAVVTIAAALAVLEPIWSGNGEVMAVGVIAVTIGAALTAARRAVRVLRAMR